MSPPNGWTPRGQLTFGAPLGLNKDAQLALLSAINGAKKSSPKGLLFSDSAAQFCEPVAEDLYAAH